MLNEPINVKDDFEYLPLTISNLKRTRAYVERGWCKHHPTLKDNVCLNEAIRLSSEYVHPTYRFQVVNTTFWMISESVRAFGYSHKSLSSFNDDDTTTQRDILMVLNNSIKLCEGRMENV